MFDLFKIGFLPVTFLDVIDILVVAYIIYKAYNIIKGTIAAQIMIGLVIVLILSFTAQATNLKALSWLLKLISDTWVIAFIILFQPEIRRMLLIVGRNPFFGYFIKSNEKNIADILTDAAFTLSQHQHGALIVVVRMTGIRSFTETGEVLNAKLNKNLLRSIFYPRSPLHDGAVVVKNDIIEAARCTLPLSSVTMSGGYPLGMRHRAGLGISEQADVISIIVSEETGSISIAENGILTRGLSKEALREKLSLSLIQQKRTKKWKGDFDGADETN
ncbi:MAG: diadenylate cyclase CdaA [Bacteroidota bacterium]